MPKNKLLKYFREAFVFDLKAGLITAVVALPLAIAFAVASGVPPVMGLYTAIFAGALGSGFGGSKFSITGPTGAMTVIALSVVHNFGINGLLFAGFLAGVIQVCFGVLKLGKIVKFIPLPIISGFTAGIGLIIFIGQIPNSLGLIIPPQETAIETIIKTIEGLGAANLIAVAITAGTFLILGNFQKISGKMGVLKNVPASLVGLVLFTALAFFFSLGVPQIGVIPPGFPAVHFPAFDFSIIKDILPSAFTIALLGSIESLLCAVVCDGMTRTKHNSNKELVGQGITNIAMPFFNGIPATAAIARSAVNIREGAKTKAAGIIHAVFLLLILLFLSPAAQFIPKAFLAGVLMFVSVKMINVNEFKTIIHVSRSETMVLFATFALTILTDLVFAVQAGMFFAIMLLFVRLTNIIDVKNMEEYDFRDKKANQLLNSNPKLKEIADIYMLHGPFFFGALNIFDRKLDVYLKTKKPVIILQMDHVPFIDSSGIVRLNAFIEERHKENSAVLLSGIDSKVKLVLSKNREFQKHFEKKHIFEDIEQAVKFAENEFVLKQTKLSIA